MFNVLRVTDKSTARAWIAKGLIRPGVYLEDQDGIFQVDYIDTDGLVAYTELEYKDDIQDFVAITGKSGLFTLEDLIGKEVL